MSTDHASYPTGLRTTPSRHRALRQRMAEPGIVVAPGCYDCVTARLVEVSGFDAAYITGSGVSMSALGAPDMGALSFGEILDRVRRICDSVSIPIIADADTGYGGPLNVIRTMREFERAGVSAVQLEDQEWPKKCGHEPGRKVASSKEMEQRIRAAADARVDADVMIVARTDAIAIEGYEAALERAARYREAGADIAFVEAPPERGRAGRGAEAARHALPRQHGRGRPHAGAAVPAARGDGLQGRDLSQLADAPVRARRPGPAVVAQDDRRHDRLRQPDARPRPALEPVRERALAGARKALPVDRPPCSRRISSS